MAAYVLGLAGALALGLALGLLGSGGSIITVPVLVYLFGQPEKQAIAGSLIVVGLVAAFGALLHARAGSFASKAFISFGPAGMLGAWSGATLSQFVSGATQLLVFALVMLAVAISMLRPARATPDTHLPAQPMSASPGYLPLLLVGAAVGMLTGFVGVGGGFLILPALVLVARVPMHAAIGTSLALIALNAAVGFGKHQLLLQRDGLHLDFRVLAVVTLLGMIGSVAGRAFAGRLAGPVLRLLFGVALLVLAVFIIAQHVHSVSQALPS